MSLAPLLLTFLAACAPVYRPPAPFVALLDEPGDVVVSGQLGVGGLQGDVAWAPLPVLQVRGGVQVGGLSGDGHYLLGKVGVGAWGASGSSRYGVHLDLGGGPSLGVTSVENGVDGSDLVEYREGGLLGTAAVRAEVGHESEVFGVGGQLGVVGLALDPDDGSRVASGVAFEAAAVVRGGSPVVQFQTHAGLSVPTLDLDPRFGVPIPFLFGLGVVVNLPAPPSPAQ